MQTHTPLPSSPDAPGIARRSVRDFLDSEGVTTVLDDALLIVSELATNAVRYGASPVTLHLSADDNTLVIAVQDSHPSDLPYPKVLTETEPDGRGMHLVSATSTRWGWDRGINSKIVWAEVGLKTS